MQNQMTTLVNTKTNTETDISVDTQLDMNVQNTDVQKVFGDPILRSHFKWLDSLGRSSIKNVYDCEFKVKSWLLGNMDEQGRVKVSHHALAEKTGISYHSAQLIAYDMRKETEDKRKPRFIADNKNGWIYVNPEVFQQLDLFVNTGNTKVNDTKVNNTDVTIDNTLTPTNTSPKSEDLIKDLIDMYACIEDSKKSAFKVHTSWLKHIMAVGSLGRVVNIDFIVFAYLLADLDDEYKIETTEESFARKHGFNTYRVKKAFESFQESNDGSYKLIIKSNSESRPGKNVYYIDPEIIDMAVEIKSDYLENVSDESRWGRFFANIEWLKKILVIFNKHFSDNNFKKMQAIPWILDEIIKNGGRVIVNVEYLSKELDLGYKTIARTLLALTGAEKSRKDPIGSTSIAFLVKDEHISGCYSVNMKMLELK